MYLFLFYEIHWNKCIILYPMVFTFASKAKCVISNEKLSIGISIGIGIYDISGCKFKVVL